MAGLYRNQTKWIAAVSLIMAGLVVGILAYGILSEPGNLATWALVAVTVALILVTTMLGIISHYAGRVSVLQSKMDSEALLEEHRRASDKAWLTEQLDKAYNGKWRQRMFHQIKFEEAKKRVAWHGISMHRFLHLFPEFWGTLDKMVRVEAEAELRTNHPNIFEAEERRREEEVDAYVAEHGVPHSPPPPYNDPEVAKKLLEIESRGLAALGYKRPGT